MKFMASFTDSSDFTPPFKGFQTSRKIALSGRLPTTVSNGNTLLLHKICEPMRQSSEKLVATKSAKVESLLASRMTMFLEFGTLIHNRTWWESGLSGCLGDAICFAQRALMNILSSRSNLHTQWILVYVFCKKLRTAACKIVVKTDALLWRQNGCHTHPVVTILFKVPWLSHQQVIGSVNHLRLLALLAVLLLFRQRPIRTACLMSKRWRTMPWIREETSKTKKQTMQHAIAEKFCPNEPKSGCSVDPKRPPQRSIRGCWFLCSIILLKKLMAFKFGHPMFFLKWFLWVKRTCNTCSTFSSLTSQLGSLHWVLHVDPKLHSNADCQNMWRTKIWCLQQKRF